jgi:hypothetical protein
MSFKEIDFCGIYLPPFFACLLVAGVLFIFLHRWWDRIVIQRWVWNRPVFELAMFIILLAVVIFIL